MCRVQRGFNRSGTSHPGPVDRETSCQTSPASVRYLAAGGSAEWRTPSGLASSALRMPTVEVPAATPVSITDFGL